MHSWNISNILRNMHHKSTWPYQSIITAYVVRREGTVFTGVCLSIGGTPVSRPRSLPSLKSCPGREYPRQDRDSPPARTGVPPPDQDWGAHLLRTRVPPPRTGVPSARTGVPPPARTGVSPITPTWWGQVTPRAVYLLRFCAGGLSCYNYDGK